MVNPRRPASGRAVRTRAQELRKTMTPAEERLWRELRNRHLAGFKFRRQHPIGRFIVDFYCAECALVIELDGPIHALQKSKDDARTEWLASCGYQELRFTNAEVEQTLQDVLHQIVTVCQRSQ